MYANNIISISVFRFAYSLHSERDAYDLLYMCYSSTDCNHDNMLIKLQRGVDPNHKCFYNEYGNGFTPLHAACDWNNIKAIQALIEWGANIEAFRSTYGNTPLHDASVSGSLEAVVTLLYYYCDKGK